MVIKKFSLSAKKTFPALYWNCDMHKKVFTTRVSLFISASWKCGFSHPSYVCSKKCNLLSSQLHHFSSIAPRPEDESEPREKCGGRKSKHQVYFHRSNASRCLRGAAISRCFWHCKKVVVAHNFIDSTWKINKEGNSLRVVKWEGEIFLLTREGGVCAGSWGAG